MKRKVVIVLLVFLSMVLLVGCKESSPQVIIGPTGEMGPQGEPGKDGTCVHTGKGIPIENFGNSGDSYINLDTWDYYVKTIDEWKLEGNIKGKEEVSHDGTAGLIFYPLNETECAVAVGTAIFLEEIIIPSKYKNYTVTEIYGDNVKSGFEECYNLRKIIIPDTITTIGNYAFYGCFNLTDVIIPDSVTKIGNYAFLGCESLETIFISRFVKEMGEEVFQNCNVKIFMGMSYKPNCWEDNWHGDNSVFWLNEE